MPSTKTPSTRPVPSIARAAQKTRSVIEDFQSRLTEVSQHAGLARLGAAGSAEKETPSLPAAAGAGSAEAFESEADLERQLAAYFASAPAGAGASSEHGSVLEELRRRVIDGVVERILEDWTSARVGQPSALRNEVMERLIERVLQQFATSTAPHTEALPS